MVDIFDGVGSDPDPVAPPRPPTSWGDRVRTVLRGIGQLLITAGVVVLLFVVYEVYVTNYFTHQAQDKVQTALRTEWRQDVQRQKQDPLRRLALPRSGGPSLPEGQGIAFLYIPRLGSDYSWAIVQGTADADLEKGPGHYTGTQLPGQKGNFAVAGHRVGKGEPFLNLDHLRPGDPVIVETQSRWFVYTVMGARDNIDQPATSGRFSYHDLPGREIVDPSDGAVTLPVPDHPEIPVSEATRKLMTMTTCNPKFTAENRMIVYAMLTRTVPADKGAALGDMPRTLRDAYYAQGA